MFAGVDYQQVVAAAELEGDVIVWDGGNNDFSFVRPDLEIVVVDPFRPGHETSYHPGEVNLRRAHIVVVSKVGSAPAENVAELVAAVRAVNQRAAIVQVRSAIRAEGGGEAFRGKRVLVVEDGPTLTHGGMSTGAGVEAARTMGAAEIVDPRPFAVGELAKVYRKYPLLGPILPAVGYFPAQLRDLQATIEAVPADVVVSATPFDITRVMSVDQAPRPGDLRTRGVGRAKPHDGRHRLLASVVDRMRVACLGRSSCIA